MNKNNIIFLMLIMISLSSYFITELIIAPIIIVILLPLAYHFKKYAFVLFIVFSYFRFQEAFPLLMPLKIPKILALITLFLIFIDIFIKETLKIEINKENKIIFLIFAYMPFNILFSTMPFISLSYFLSVYFKILLMALMLSFIIKNKQDFKIINYAIIISGIIISTIAIYNKFNGIGLVEGTRVTISRNLGSILGDPNDLSLIILFPFAFIISFMSIKTNNLTKIKNIILGLITIMAILATQSRGGILAIIAVIVLALNENIKNKSLFFIIISMFSILIFLFSGIGERSVLNEASDNVLDASAQSRLDSWATAFYMGIKNPFFGIGLDTFINNYFYYTDAWDGKYHETHSTWLKAFSEGGFIFFTLFIILFIQTFKRILRTKKLLKETEDLFLIRCSYSLYYAIVAFAVSSTFLTQTYTWPIYIIWALSIGLENIAKNQKNKI